MDSSPDRSQRSQARRALELGRFQFVAYDEKAKFSVRTGISDCPSPTTVPSPNSRSETIHAFLLRCFALLLYGAFANRNAGINFVIG